jgi:TfdA family taurine catabolism dioxygenase TauD
MTSFKRFQNSPMSVSELRAELVLHGWSCVPLEPGDVTGESMQDIVRALGTPISQDAVGTMVWQVREQAQLRPRITCADPGPQALGLVPRSWTLDEFPFHTDGSFEDPQPTHVALYAVRADHKGGGQTQLKSVAEILSHLSNDSRHVLLTTLYRFRVPPEFVKDAADRCLPIVYGDGLMRWRHEQIDETEATPAQRVALAELADAIETVQPICLNLHDGDLLVVDNGRFLHARTAILDPQRHLLRMRFAMSGEVVGRRA